MLKYCVMELKLNQIIYSSIDGYGIVTDRYNDSSVVFFEKTKRSRDFIDKNELPDDILINVSNLKLSDIANLGLLNVLFKLERIKRRGYYYFHDKDCYEIINYNDNFIEAEFFGSDEYETSITFDGEIITFSCSCPYGFLCKHLYALVLYLKNFSSFNEAKIRQESEFLLKNGISENKKPINNIKIEKTKVDPKIEKFAKTISEVRDYREIYRKTKDFLYENMNNSKILEEFVPYFVFTKNFNYPLFNDFMIAITASFLGTKDILKKYEGNYSATRYKNSFNSEFLNILEFAINNSFIELHEYLDSLDFEKKSYKYRNDTNIYFLFLEEITNLNIVQPFIMYNLTTCAKTNDDKVYIFNTVKDKSAKDFFLMHYLDSDQNTDLFRKIDPKNFFFYLKVNPFVYQFVTISTYLFFVKFIISF